MRRSSLPCPRRAACRRTPRRSSPGPGSSCRKAAGRANIAARISGVPDVEVLFLSASEIVSKLAAGGAHLGVTGEDLVREGIADADERVELLTPLGFGQANVVVAVPQAWIDVRTMADLDEVAADLRARHGRKMRVATKYVNLTRRFFAEQRRRRLPHRREPRARPKGRRQRALPRSSSTSRRPARLLPRTP